MDIVLKLRELRRMRGLSQEEAAVSSGVGVKTLSSFESGRRVHSMKLSQLMQLLAVYDVTLAEFFGAGVERAVFGELERLDAREARLIASFRALSQPARERLADKLVLMIEGAAAAENRTAPSRRPVVPPFRTRTSNAFAKRRKEILMPEVVPGLIAHCGAEYLGRQDLLALPTPDPTATHVPVSHASFVETLIQTLGFRNLDVVEDQYAVTPDGMRMFGLLVLNLERDGVRVSIGIRNAHDKSMSLGITTGYRVIVCDNMAFHGDFQTVTRKHSKGLVLEDVLAVAVDRMQRHFDPMLRRVDAWRGYELADAAAKLVIYRAFIEGALPVAKHLAKDVHTRYFEPEHEEFKPRTFWSLSNAFTSAFKELDPLPRFRATAALAPFLGEVGGGA